HHYSFEWVKPKPLAERCDCLGVRERIDSHGRVLLPLIPEEMNRLATDIEARLGEAHTQETAIAVCLLVSYLNPQHELPLTAYLQSTFPTITLSISHEVAPIWREYERGCTTAVDAFIKPILTRYVDGVRSSLKQLGGRVPWTIMKSNGGHATPDAVERQPVN